MEILTVIKLDNGKTFDDKKKALDFIEDSIGAEIDDIFKLCPNANFRARIELVKAILEKPQKFLNVSKIVEEYIEVKTSDF